MNMSEWTHSDQLKVESDGRSCLTGLQLGGSWEVHPAVDVCVTWSFRGGDEDKEDGC